MKRILLLFLLLFSFMLHGQDFYPSQKKFDKTRIQYQKFVWKFFTSQNFEVYYFGKNEALARSTIQILEAEFPRITDILGYSPFNKIKLFVYPSHQDWIQSNTGISLDNAEEAKAENFAKFKVEIAFQNNTSEYKKELVREVTKVYVNDMLFGGSIKDALQNSLLLSVPEWFSEGIAAYMAEGDSPEMNQFMYQVVVNNRVRKPNLAQGKESIWLGHSIWAYLVKTYGKQPVSNILNLTRIIRNEQSSISSTIKKPFSKFLREWFEYYLNQSKQEEVNTVALNGLKNLTSVDMLNDQILGDFKISPDGKWLAYVLGESGKFQVNLMNLSNQRSQSIFQTGLKDSERISTDRGPILSWGKSNALSILYSAEGNSYLQTYSALTANKFSLRVESKKKLIDLNCLDFEMASNGQRMLVRALRNGQVDVGIYDLRRNRYTAVTQDANDEIEAHWWNNGNDVAYITEKYVDSTWKPTTSKEDIYSLYHWKADEPSNPNRIFAHRGYIHNLRQVSDSVWTFLSEETSGTNLISLRWADTTFYQNAARSGPWRSVEWAKDQIVVRQNDMLTQMISTYPVGSVLSAGQSRWYPQIAEIPSTDLSIQSTKDSVDKPLLRRADQRRARIELRQQSQRLRKDPGKLLGPVDYQNSFVVNKSEGNFMVDPIRGLGYSFEVKMNDLLENHLVRTGIFVTSNLRNADLWAEYGYLANKVDWFVRFDRKVLDQENESFSQKVRYNRIEVKGVYPFNLLSKLSFTGSFSSNRAIDQFSLTTPENLATYAGAKLEYTFDNTVHLDENLRTGFRMNLSAEYQTGLALPQNFSRIRLDMRRYLKLTNSFILAARLSASNALGSAAPQTMLGGVDNWLFIQRENRNKENPMGTAGIAQRDVFMSDVASPLRGFNVNKLSGQSHILLNLELRVPLKSLMGPDFSKSRFMNSFQFAGFTDIGSAWTGSNPFARTNGFNTNTYGGNTNPFLATVTDFRNPFLVGYGLGARAYLLGYFIKLDYAFGMDNKEIKAPVTYLSFGYDF